MTTLFQELQLTYPMRNVPPHGDCLIIPGDKFDPDFEVFLDDAGHNCVFTELDQQKVTLVLSRAHSKIERKKTVDEPKMKIGGERKTETKMEEKKEVKRPNMRSPEMRWSEQEDALLVELWNQGFPVHAIITQFRAKFPKRSPGGVSARTSLLQVKGRIQSRWKKNRKGKTIAKAEKAPALSEIKPLDYEERQKVIDKRDLELAVTNLALEAKRNFETLSQGYDALSTRFAELKTELNEQAKFIVENLLTKDSILARLSELRHDLCMHEHSEKSGKVTVPLEASF